MRRLGKRLYRLFVFGFIAALAYSLWLRQYAPGLWRQKLDPMSFGLIVAFVLFSAAQLYFHHFRYRDVKLEQIDSMDGEAFEHFVVTCSNAMATSISRSHSIQAIKALISLRKRRVRSLVFSASDILALLAIRLFRRSGQAKNSISSIKPLF